MLPCATPISWLCKSERVFLTWVLKTDSVSKLLMEVGKLPLRSISFRSCIIPYHHVLS